MRKKAPTSGGIERHKKRGSRGLKRRKTVRRVVVHNKAKGKSAVTNGNQLLLGVDNRNIQARRLRDVMQLHVADMGGEAAGLSEGQLSLARRAAALTVELETFESRFAQQGGAKAPELETYQRVTNSLRRLLESLGIHRGRLARDVSAPSLQEYLAGRGGGGRIIDHQPRDD